MAGSFSDFLEAALLAHVFRGVVYSPPSALYLAMFTSLPTDAGPGIEVVGGGYARQAVVFSSPVAGVIVNVGDVTYPISSAIWGNLVGFGVFDALAGGNMLAWGELLGKPYPAQNIAGALFNTPGAPFVLGGAVELDPSGVLGGNVPSPFLDNTTYYVALVNPGPSIGLENSPGSGLVLPVVAGTGYYMAKTYKQAIPKAVQLIIPDGTLSISLD